MLKIMSEQKKPGLQRPVEQYYETPHKTDSYKNAENAALSKFCVNTKFQSTKLQTWPDNIIPNITSKFKWSELMYHSGIRSASKIYCFLDDLSAAAQLFIELSFQPILHELRDHFPEQLLDVVHAAHSTEPQLRDSEL